MLNIENLRINIGEKEIVKGLNLKVGAGEVHAIMGPNGAGKSTLGNVIAGKEGYDVAGGSILLKGEDIGEMDAHERSLAGIYLAFQYPVEIPGVSCTQFLRESMNAHLRERGEKEMSGAEFVKMVRSKQADLKMGAEFLKRNVNCGFSGGEKKRFDILHMSLLQPELCILDETDSGLDIDALKVVADGVNAMRADNRSFVIVTHYKRLLQYIKPDYVHVMADGVITKTGGMEVADMLEAEGYEGAAA